MSVEEAERKGSARNRTSVSQLGSRDPARSQKLSVVAPRPFDKQAVLVLGMHRSGTSAVTRFLNRLGAHLPSKLIPPDADSNVHGFWEPRNIVDIHDELLASAGSSWDDVAAFPRSWFDSELAQSFQDRVVRILRSDFGDSRLFVLKDPRMCRLVPFWRSVLNEFGAARCFIIPVRHPLEVAASLKVRHGFLTAKALLLWLWHLLEAERETRGERRSFVHYSQLLRDWRGTAERIAQDCEISWPRTSHEAAVEIERFLSESARHHSFSAEELESRSEIVDWVKRAYAATLATDDEDDSSLVEVFDDVRRSLQAADQAFGPLLAEARLNLAGQAEQLARTLAARDEEQTSRDIRIQQLSADLANREAETHQLQEKAGAQGQEIERLSETIAARDTEAATQAQKIEELTSRISSLDEGAAAGQLEIERLSERIAARDAEVEARTREIERLHGEATLAGRHIAELRQDVASLRTSISWRITEPLRAVAGLLMRKKRL